MGWIPGERATGRPERRRVSEKQRAGPDARSAARRRGSADRGGLHVVVDMRHVLREILGEHLDQLGGLRVVGCRVVPGAARVEQDVGHAGRPSTGTSKPKFGSLRNFASASEPSSAAVSSARVALIGIREPVP